MKTNTFNYFRNAFAIVGFFIIACSVGTSDYKNNGKYQISLSNNNDGSIDVTAVILNTDTGSAKLYTISNDKGWIDRSGDITFTH